MRKTRVAVAMSGGVDSCVAAALLKEQGSEVIGITMGFTFNRSSVEDARKAADMLGIEHHVFDLSRELQKEVIADFCRQYQRGLTPNPCINCNQYIKFGVLLKQAMGMGVASLATGHYARIGQASGRCVLKKARDLQKDQSYFLYRLKQSQLRRVLFPLGGYSKQHVRQLARKFGLPAAEKKDSQEICFLQTADYRAFLRQNGVIASAGPVVDGQGRIVGEHQGVSFYTIGQRQGLGIALGYPAYVIKIDPKKNTITVASKKEACSKEFLIKEPYFPAGSLKKNIALKVKIRYNHKETAARLGKEHGRLKVILRKPQFAVTPGQSAVFYHNDSVIGGGVIDKVVA